MVTESIFSMDGDAADLRGLVNLKHRRPFVLLLDEAHGSGVYGSNGSGYANETGTAPAVDVFIVTLSKAAGCAGGAVCGSASFCESVINFGRAYIYSTAISPAVAAGCQVAIEVMEYEPQRQQRVRALAARTRAALTAAGWAMPAGNSPILPIIVGDEATALALSERLREKGMIASVVRPPTVPRGSSRLRITLTYDHTDEEVAALIAALGSAPTR